MKKRLAVLFLSFGTIICYGYALGGLGGYLFGRGRPMVAAAGLIFGSLSAWLAIVVWRKYLDEIAEEERGES